MRCHPTNPWSQPLGGSHHLWGRPIHLPTSTRSQLLNSEHCRTKAFLLSLEKVTFLPQSLCIYIFRAFSGAQRLWFCEGSSRFRHLSRWPFCRQNCLGWSGFSPHISLSEVRTFNTAETPGCRALGDSLDLVLVLERDGLNVKQRSSDNGFYKRIWFGDKIAFMVFGPLMPLHKILKN